MSSNFEQLDPNYVITFDYSNDNLTQLLTELSVKGLHVLTRPGYDSKTLYAYTRVEDHGFQTNIKSSRSIDVTEQSGNEILYRVCEPLKFVQSITPIYDLETRHKLDSFSNSLIKKSVLLPYDSDLIKLSQLTKNPRQALYFAFFKTYIQWLSALSMIGVFFRFSFRSTPSSEFSVPYSLCLLVWSILFTGTWVFRNESKFSSKIGKVNGYFGYTHIKLSSPTTVLYKKLCFIPVAILFAMTLIAYQFFCFFVEIFLNQFYEGPLKSILSLMPLILLSVFVPFLTNLYNKIFVDKLVQWENGPNPVKSKVEKNFVLTFLTSYMPLLITLFFYLPMGYKLTPEWKNLIVRYSNRYYIPVQATDFIIDVNRYRNQFFYFTVTNHIVVMAMEDIVPFLIDKLMPLIKKNPNQKIEADKLKSVIMSNYPAEIKLWSKINYFNRTAYAEFDVDDNYRKLVVQFGYIAIFSTIWPLAPLFCVCFNHIIYKLDLWRALQKCKPSSNPNNLEVAEDSLTATAVSADPWNTILEAITWLGAIISPSLITMYRYSALPGVGLQSALEKRDLWYRHSPISVSWTTVLLVAVITEHAALLAYVYLTKVFNASTDKFVYGFVPAVESQEPPKINLSSMVKETVGLMNQVSDDKSAIKTTKSAPVNAKETPNSNTRIPKTETTPHLHERNNAFNKTDSEDDTGAAVMLDNAKSDSSSKMPKSEVVSSKDITEPSAATVEDKAENVEPSTDSSKDDSLGSSGINSSSDDALSAAGATVPETIPTSKNYHLRYDKNGNPIQSPNSTATSKSSLVEETAVPSDREKQEHLSSSSAPNEKKKTNPELRNDLSKNAIGEVNKSEASEPKKDEILIAKGQKAAAPDTNNLGNHSRTSSSYNAVQQFGREVPTSMNSTKSNPDQSHGPLKTPQNPQSKAVSSVQQNGHAAPRKKSSASKKSSTDVSSKESKEPKQKHKIGLLRKLKKKL